MCLRSSFGGFKGQGLSLNSRVHKQVLEHGHKHLVIIIKMNTGKQQTCINLLGALVWIVVLLPCLMVEAAPTAERQISLEKQDWIDKGLDKYYEIIHGTKGVSIPLFNDVGIRIGETYTTEERTNFVIGVIAAGICAIMLLSCFVRCLCGRQR